MPTLSYPPGITAFQSGVTVTTTTTKAFTTGSQTMTAAQLIGGVISSANAGAVTFTTDTAANLDAALNNPAVGDTFTCVLLNLGTNTITLAGGSSVTLQGNTAVATGKNALLVFVRTATTPTYTCNSIVSA